MLMKIWTGSLLFLAWMFFCAWLVLVCREKNVHPLRDFATFFKKQTKAGRIILGTFFIAMWVIASTKPGDGGGNGGGEGGGGDVSPERSEHCEAMSLEGCGTNNIQMVIGPGGGLQPLVSPGAVTNGQQQGFLGGIQPPQGGLLGDPAPVTDEWSDFTPITSTNTTRTLDGDDFRRGFVLTCVGTDEAFTFAAPPERTCAPTGARLARPRTGSTLPSRIGRSGLARTRWTGCAYSPSARLIRSSGTPKDTLR